MFWDLNVYFFFVEADFIENEANFLLRGGCASNEQCRRNLKQLEMAVQVEKWKEGCAGISGQNNKLLDMNAEIGHAFQK